MPILWFILFPLSASAEPFKMEHVQLLLDANKSAIEKEIDTAEVTYGIVCIRPSKPLDAVGTTGSDFKNNVSKLHLGFHCWRNAKEREHNPNAPAWEGAIHFSGSLGKESYIGIDWYNPITKTYWHRLEASMWRER